MRCTAPELEPGCSDNSTAASKTHLLHALIRQSASVLASSRIGTLTDLLLSECPEVRDAAIANLRQAFDDQEQRTSLLYKEDASQALHSGLSRALSYGTPLVVVHALDIVQKFLAECACDSYLAGGEVARALLSLMEESADKCIQEKALTALGVLSARAVAASSAGYYRPRDSTAYLRAALKGIAAATPRVLQLIRSKSSAEVVEGALTLLDGTLTCYPDRCTSKLLESNGVPCVLKLLVEAEARCNSPKVHEAAAHFLQKLAECKGCWEGIIEAGGIPAWVKQLGAAAMPVQQTAVSALIYFVEQDAGCEADILRACGATGTASLLELLLNGPDDNTKDGVFKLLRKLVSCEDAAEYMCPVLEQHLRSAGESANWMVADLFTRLLGSSGFKAVASALGG